MLNVMKKAINLLVATALGLYAYSPVAAQTMSRKAAPTASQNSLRESNEQQGTTGREKSAQHLDQARTASAPEEAAIQAQINSVYQRFYNSYRLGAGDIIAVYVDKHPEDSVERAVVSPVGQIYYPLMGNVNVAGKTLSQLTDYFTAAISEYIRDPRVTISMVEANSAKIGVLGDVHEPGVIIMTRPMRVLDAISAARGISDTGNSSKVSVLRQYEDGRLQTLTVNVKSILSGKASPEENIYLQAGDTVIVHGNWVKKIGTISSVMGLGSFFTFLTSRGR